jgi:hypothetical protein
VRREYLVVGKDATVRQPNGSTRRMRESDIDEQLRRAERNPDGSYRVGLSEALRGKVLEGFKYEGTRPDDPNDVIPHENRRELRGLRVFSAWLNHTDAKAINSMDVLVQRGAGQRRHRPARTPRRLRVPRGSRTGEESPPRIRLLCAAVDDDRLSLAEGHRAL